ncbi:MAG TPA: DUF2185 domain-containing protein [Brevundimonas sp.]|jgi:hypothetical protein|uniref:immunity protein Imm33 domain-containing protein n=1 Tax=Brevundimonas aurantiaca TaxID=74316 RepID=UPI000C991935|nr:hypothetical protein [Brevundimonas sp.]HAF82252.1 DUF2185 domain-containing protein [Brevundimonas sp.]
MWEGADYRIVDPRPIAASAPYTFFLPNPLDVAALKDGDFIKATVKSVPESAQWDAERLWFVITSVSDEAFEARLESDPRDMPNLEKGRVIQIPRPAVVDLIFSDDRAQTVGPREYWERCLVDGAVLNGARRIEFIYREDADNTSDSAFHDSGWRIRATTSGLSALEAEQATVECVALGAVLNKDDSWLHLIDAPAGSAFLRDFENNIWVEEKE